MAISILLPLVGREYSLVTRTIRMNMQQPPVVLRRATLGSNLES